MSCPRAAPSVIDSTDATALLRAGRADTNFKPDLDRSQMPKSMQLGEFSCPGSCGKHNYKNLMSLQGHIRACIAMNEVGKPGQNGCWQPGFSPPLAGEA